MTEHFLRSTVSAALWCAKCQKETQHRIDDARAGPCLACIERLEQAHNAAVRESGSTISQGMLWEGLTDTELAQKREEYEERAGIKQFDANMPRDQAEQEAWLEVYGRKR